MQYETTEELKNKISELKHRLNQLYAQYFSDTREGRVFEAEFSLYVKAAEHARREKSELLRLQCAILLFGMFLLIGSAGMTIVLFRQQLLLSAFFLLGLGFFACGFLYLLVSVDIRIAQANRFCLDIGEYFQQHRWRTEIKQNLHLPDIPLWEDYSNQRQPASSWNRRCESRALSTPFRIAISFIDLLVPALLIQMLLSGDAVMSRPIMVGYLFLWLAIVCVHMLLVNSLTARADMIHLQDIAEETYPQKSTGIRHAFMQIPRLFFLLDIVFPKGRGTGKDVPLCAGKNPTP